MVEIRESLKVADREIADDRRTLKSDARVKFVRA